VKGEKKNWGRRRTPDGQQGILVGGEGGESLVCEFAQSRERQKAKHENQYQGYRHGKGEKSPAEKKRERRGCAAQHLFSPTGEEAASGFERERSN